MLHNIDIRSELIKSVELSAANKILEYPKIQKNYGDLLEFEKKILTNSQAGSVATVAGKKIDNTKQKCKLGFKNSSQMKKLYQDLELLVKDDIYDGLYIGKRRNVDHLPNSILLGDKCYFMNEKNLGKQTKIKVEKKKKKEETIIDYLEKAQETCSKQNISFDIQELEAASHDGEDDEENSDSECDDDDDEDDGEYSRKKNGTACKGCLERGTLTEDQHSSTIVCSSCGMVNEEILDYGPEWRQYSNDDNRGESNNRCGGPSNYFFPKSTQGTIMVGINNSRLQRKQKWNSMVYKERSLNNVFEIITKVCVANKIPKIIIDTSKILYKHFSDHKHTTGVNIGKQIIIRGDNRKSIIAACVLKACTLCNDPRNSKEIAGFFGLMDKKVTKGSKQFNKILEDLDNNPHIVDNYYNNITEDYIRRQCPKLKIDPEDTQLAVKIAYNCCKLKLASDHNPQSIAAGSILLMVQYRRLRIDKKTIAKLFVTSDVTVGKIYKKIYPFATALVDSDATDFLIKRFNISV